MTLESLRLCAINEGPVRNFGPRLYHNRAAFGHQTVEQFQSGMIACVQAAREECMRQLYVGTEVKN
jgi:hypothetical protein